MSYNMRISPYISPCCSVLAAFLFTNLTKFECSHRCAAITYTHDIFHNKWKRSYHATWQISNLSIENEYHHLTLQNKFWLLLNKGVLFLNEFLNCYIASNQCPNRYCKHKIEIEICFHISDNVPTGCSYSNAHWQKSRRKKGSNS